MPSRINPPPIPVTKAKAATPITSYPRFIATIAADIESKPTAASSNQTGRKNGFVAIDALCMGKEDRERG
ncbi:MAG: hypothetical protein SynsKO_09340 [Synoicihabitans sp.]